MFQERLLRCVFSGFDLTLKLFHDRTSRTMGTLFSENSRSIAASMPADTRIYAVGDIHGRADLLIETIARIDEETARAGRSARRLKSTWVITSIAAHIRRTVIDLLAMRLVEHRAVCLRGNHEDLMWRFIQNPTHLHHWQQLGGMQTLASYGVCQRSEQETDANLHRQLFI